jgi:hypothetical protein
MLVVSRRLIGIALALTLLGSATAAARSATSPLYRTDQQAQNYLVYGLKRWAHIDLREAASKSAFCVSTTQQKSGEPERDRFRSFSCVFYVTGERGRTRVFGLHLVSTRAGWHVAAPY